MADYINNIAAGDQYTPGCSIGPDFDANFVVVTIANNPALMQFAVGDYGSWRWTDEREFFSIPQSFRVGNVRGVRVRNANPGSVVRVLAVLAGDADPDFQSGMPFAGILSASGGISVTGGLTGHINADGTIAAGSGFTVSHDSGGRYTVTFTTPFTNPPLVICQPADDLGTASNIDIPVGANKFSVHIFNSNNLADRDSAFFFEANPIV